MLVASFRCTRHDQTPHPFRMNPPSDSPAAAADADVIVVGAGPAGLTLASALAELGITVQVLEQQPLAAVEDPAEDGREIALTHRARKVMEQLGLWSQLAPGDISPLRQARVLDGNGSGQLRFASPRAAGDPLGWLVPNHLIRRAAIAAARRHPQVRIEGDARVTGLALDAEQARVTLADGRTLAGDLVVAADSRFSNTRRMAGIGASLHDFARSALLVRVEHEGTNPGIAWECFRYGNTLALLPLSEHLSSAVITIPSDDVARFQAMSDGDLAALLARQAPRELGTLRIAGARHSYPLVGVYAHDFVARRLALIGDAAVGMHPVTAHGWNFGLYGVEVLSREIRAARDGGRGIADPTALRRYAQEHRKVTLPTYLGTNAVVKLFTDDRQLPRLLRQGVLAIAEHLPPFSGLIKGTVTRQLMG